MIVDCGDFIVHLFEADVREPLRCGSFVQFLLPQTPYRTFVASGKGVLRRGRALDKERLRKGLLVLVKYVIRHVGWSLLAFLCVQHRWRMWMNTSSRE